MNPKIFFGELKRRNVYKVAVAYAVVGWLLIQVATQVFPFLEISNWAIRLVILMTALGFPVALIIAWAFELTPEGRQAHRSRRCGTTTFARACLDRGCCRRCNAFVRPFFPRPLHGSEHNASIERDGYSVEPTEIDCGAAAGQHQWRSQQRVFFRWPLRGINRSASQDSRPQGHRTQLVFLLQRQIRTILQDNRSRNSVSPI